MTHRKPRSLIRTLLHRLAVVAGGLTLTLAFFLVLPFMQSIGQTRTDLLDVVDVDTGRIEAPPPPPPEPEEPEEEEKQDDPPPELAEDNTPLTLEQLDVALNPQLSDGATSGDFGTSRLETLVTAVTSGGEEVQAIFGVLDLDQKPRAIYQPSPSVSSKIREKAPGTAYVIFVVDPRGRVENPIVQRSSDPVFEGPALAAVKQWKFEPGKRNGEAVRFRMRVPISFPKGR